MDNDEWNNWREGYNGYLFEFKFPKLWAWVQKYLRKFKIFN